MTHPFRSTRVTMLVSVVAALWPLGVSAAGVDKLKAFVSNTQSARAAFVQTVESKSGRKPSQSAGHMVFSRPGKFRWEYDKPYAQLLVGDGEKLWIWDRDLNQVTVRRLTKALGSTPAAILAGRNELEQNFVLSEGETSDGVEWAEARPKAKDASFERMRFGFSGDQLKAMELFDNLGQHTLLVFNGFQRNPAVPADQFRFVPPKGADVLEE